MELAQMGDFGALRQKESVAELLKLNSVTAPFGLALTEEQAIALSQNREAALRQTARLEFGGGILSKLVLAFRDSPYLPGDDPIEILSELTELFYEYKNETLDALTDDELLTAMKTAFDGPCHGSTELLAGKSLEALARYIRSGPEDESADEGDDDEWD